MARQILKVQPTSIKGEAEDQGSTFEYQYYPNGTRRLTTLVEGYVGSVIIAKCEGPDLYEQVLARYNGAGVSIERTVNHAACIDGRLDAVDFEG